MVFARAEVAFLSRSYYWKPVTQEEAVLLDLLAEKSPARAGTGCFCLIQILCPVSYMPLTEVQRSLLRCKPHSGNWEAALEAPCRSPCWHLSGSITECLGWEGWGCKSSLSSSSSLLTSMLEITPVAANKGDKGEPGVPSWHSCHLTRAVGIATTCLSSFLWGTTRTRSGDRFPQHSQHMLWLWGTCPRAKRTQLSLCNVAHFRFAVCKQQIPP